MNKLVQGSWNSLVRSYSNMMVKMVGFCVALALLCGWIQNWGEVMMTRMSTRPTGLVFLPILSTYLILHWFIFELNLCFQGWKFATLAKKRTKVITCVTKLTNHIILSKRSMKNYTSQLTLPIPCSVPQVSLTLPIERLIIIIEVISVLSNFCIWLDRNSFWMLETRKLCVL